MVALGRRIAEVRLRPDGAAIGWIQRGIGPAELVIKDLGTGSDGSLLVGPEIVITNRPGPFAPHPDGGGAWCWTPDSTHIVFCGPGGLWLIPATGGVARLIVSTTDGRHVWSPVVSPDLNLVAFVDEGDADAWVSVAPLDGSWLPRRVSDADADFVMDPDWGTNGRLAWHAWSVPSMPWDAGWIDVKRIDAAGDSVGDVLAAARHTGGCVGQPRWNGDRLSFTDDAGGWINVRTNQYTYDLEIVREDGSDPVRTIDHFEHAGPTWGPGQRTTAWCPDGRVITFERNEEGFGRLCVTGASPHDVTGPGVSRIGRGIHTSLSWATTADGVDRIAALRQGATTPNQIVIYQRAANATDPSVWNRTIVAVSAVGGWNAVDLVEPTVITATAVDGTVLHGRLYRRADCVGPAPTLVSIHGGPTGQKRVSWDARFAAYIAAGWQVFVPDHRGTTGWGRDFQQALNGRWGEVDVTDVADAVRGLIAEGLVDPARVVVSGGSAGGFAVLCLLIAEPDMFTAGIALYPVADLVALDDTTHRYEAHYQRTLIGRRPEFESRYIDRSPLRMIVDQGATISVPLLLFHGVEDQVVNVAQSDALVAALHKGQAGGGQAGGTQVEYVRFPGEGHGWSNPETTMVEHQKVMAFLAAIWPSTWS